MTHESNQATTANALPLRKSAQTIIEETLEKNLSLSSRLARLRREEAGDSSSKGSLVAELSSFSEQMREIEDSYQAQEEKNSDFFQAVGLGSGVLLGAEAGLACVGPQVVACGVGFAVVAAGHQYNLYLESQKHQMALESWKAQALGVVDARILETLQGSVRRIQNLDLADEQLKMSQIAFRPLKDLLDVAKSSDFTDAQRIYAVSGIASMLENRLNSMKKGQTSLGAIVMGLEDDDEQQQIEINHLNDAVNDLGESLTKVANDVDVLKVQNVIQDVQIDHLQQGMSLIDEKLGKQELNLQMVTKIVFNEFANVNTMGLEYFNNDIANLAEKYEALRASGSGASDAEIAVAGAALQKKVEEFSSKIDSFVGALDFLGQIGASFGSQKMQQVVQVLKSGVNIALGVARFVGGDPLGGMMQVARGLGGLFGGFQGQQDNALAEALQQISQQIQALSEQMTQMQYYMQGEFAGVKRLVMQNGRVIRLGIQEIISLMHSGFGKILEQFLAVRGELHGLSNFVINVLAPQLNRLTAITKAGFESLYVQRYDDIMFKARYYTENTISQGHHLTPREAHDTYVKMMRLLIHDTMADIFHQLLSGEATLASLYEEVDSTDPWSAVNKLVRFAYGPQGYNLPLNLPELPPALKNSIKGVECPPVSFDGRFVNPRVFMEMARYFTDFISATPKSVLHLSNSDRCVIQESIQYSEWFLQLGLLLKTDDKLFKNLIADYEKPFSEFVSFMYTTLVEDFKLKPSEVKQDVVTLAAEYRDAARKFIAVPYENTIRVKLDNLSVVINWAWKDITYFYTIPGVLERMVFDDGDCRNPIYDGRAAIYQSIYTMFERISGQEFLPYGTIYEYASDWKGYDYAIMDLAEILSITEQYEEKDFFVFRPGQKSKAEVERGREMAINALQRLHEVTCCGCDEVGLKNLNNGQVERRKLQGGDRQTQLYRNALAALDASVENNINRGNEYREAKEGFAPRFTDIKNRLRASLALEVPEQTDDLSNHFSARKMLSLINKWFSSSTVSDREAFKTRLLTNYQQAGELKQLIDQMSYLHHALSLYLRLAFAEGFERNLWINEHLPVMRSGQQIMQSIQAFNPASVGERPFDALEKGYYLNFEQKTDFLMELKNYVLGEVATAQVLLANNTLSPVYYEMYATKTRLCDYRDVFISENNIESTGSTASTASTGSTASTQASTVNIDVSSTSASLPPVQDEMPNSNQPVLSEAAIIGITAIAAIAAVAIVAVIMRGLRRGQVNLPVALPQPDWDQQDVTVGPFLNAAYDPNIVLMLSLLGLTGVVGAAGEKQSQALCPRVEVEFQCPVDGFSLNGRVLMINEQAVLAIKGEAYAAFVFAKPEVQLPGLVLSGTPFKERHITGDTYNKASCQPISFYGRPAVACHGEQTTMVYFPGETAGHQQLLEFYSELSSNVALGAVTWHAASKAYHGVKNYLSDWWYGRVAEEEIFLSAEAVSMELQVLDNLLMNYTADLSRAQLDYPKVNWTWLASALDDHRVSLKTLVDKKHVTAEEIKALYEDCEAYYEEYTASIAEAKTAQAQQACRKISRVALNGLAHHSVPADGSCLYHALGDQLGYDAQVLRHLTASYLQNHFDEFTSFIPEEQKHGYVERVASGEEWGDHLTIEIIQKMTHRPVVVLTPGRPVIPENAMSYPGEPMFVFFNGRQDDTAHYDRLDVLPGKSARAILSNILKAMHHPEDYTDNPITAEVNQKQNSAVHSQQTWTDAFCSMFSRSHWFGKAEESTSALEEGVSKLRDRASAFMSATLFNASVCQPIEKPVTCPVLR